MNLSSYLQMPPAPLVPTHPNNAVPQGPRTGVGPSAGDNLGFDFAQVMAHQMTRLVAQERQTFAADAPEHPPTQAKTTETRDASDTRRVEREAQADEQDGDRRTTARQRSKTAPHKTEHADVDALLEGLLQGTPVPATPATASSTITAANNAVATTPATTDLASSVATLQTIELSPQIRLITDPKAAPSPESLAAFAKSMGLDESAIQKLLDQAPATPTPSQPGAAASATGLPTTGTDALQAALRTAQGLAASTASTPDSVATQLDAMSATPSPMPVASGAGLAAPATTLVAPPVSGLPGLTPTDMAAIQQLQITVLPAAVQPVTPAPTNNAATPSTLDMLSLLGTGVDEREVSALLSRFSEDAGSEGHSDEQPSQGDDPQFGGFAQVLARSTTTAGPNPANAAQASATHMSEVYDQLSDKMATEMAARMHKQLSDGEWKMKFALRPSNLGGVEIQLEMKDGKLDAVFRADNPLTRDLLQNSSQRLREALGNFGINAGQVNVGQGGNSQHNGSGNSGKQSLGRDNSSTQVNGTSSATSAATVRNKVNASLLDLYA